jgi:hypothetical protein
MAPNICWPSLWNKLHINIVAPRIWGGSSMFGKIYAPLFMLIHLFRMTITSALLSQTLSIHDERRCSKSVNKISLGWTNILISISVQPVNVTKTRVQAWLTGWRRTLHVSRHCRLTWSFKDTERNKNALLETCQFRFCLYDPTRGHMKGSRESNVNVAVSCSSRKN